MEEMHPLRPSLATTTRQTSISPPPVPALQDLLDASSDDISQLSIYALKYILNAYNFSWPPSVEKSELVEMVVFLINHARAERDFARRREEILETGERQRREDYARHSREQEERRRQPPPSRRRRRPPARENAIQSEVPQSTPQPQAPPRHHSPPTPILASERTGLCAICLDEDANILVLDCRHLCLCQDCSEGVMASTRQCPVCRRRIVSQERLLKIFKT